jgi:hypothetical protein
MPAPATSMRASTGYVPREGRHAGLDRRPQGRAFRPRGLDHHAGCRHRRRRAAGGRAGLVGNRRRTTCCRCCAATRTSRRGEGPDGLAACCASTTCSRPSTTRPSAARCCARWTSRPSCRPIAASRPHLYHVKLGFFCPGTPMASEAGSASAVRPARYRARPSARSEAAAGYKGEKVVLMVAATDYAQFKAMGDVMADMLGSRPA